MKDEFSFLKDYKGLLDNFIDKEPRLAEYLKNPYSKIDAKLRKKIIDLKNVSDACPYCNRNYINSTYTCFTVIIVIMTYL